MVYMRGAKLGRMILNIWDFIVHSCLYFANTVVCNSFKFTMSVDVFLLMKLLALFHRTTALPARIPSPGRAPRPSCVIPKPRLPKPHSCFPTDPDSICLPTSVLTVPLGLLYSAVVPKGAFSIRDQHKPPNPLVSTLGSNWRGAQARWFNVHGQFSSVLTGTAPLGLIYSAVVPKGAFSIRDLHKPPNPQVSTLGSSWRGAQARWFNANHQAEAPGQAPSNRARACTLWWCLCAMVRPWCIVGR